jgi:hypothetical protein
MGKGKITAPIAEGFLRGIGWAVGVTFGFAMVSTLIVVLLNMSGGIPVVGGFIATIIEATVSQLSSRTPDYIR